VVAKKNGAAAQKQQRGSHLKKHQWPKGVSGNPGGKRRGESVTSRIRKLLQENGGERARQVANIIVTLAEQGDVPMIKELLNRTEGKVPERIAGHDGGPILQRVVKEVNFDLGRL